MAILQNTLIGRAKRSIGGVTFSTWKGLNVGKSKPVSVANPNSIKQQMRRSALTQIVAIFRLIPGAIDAGFKNLAIHKSAYNAYAGLNLLGAFDYTAPPVATIVPLDLMFSKGTIFSEPANAFTCDVSDGVAKATFDTGIDGVGQSTTDLATLVVFNQTQNKWGANVKGAARSTGQITLSDSIVPFTAGDTMYGYLSFSSVTDNSVSDSQASQVTAVA